MQGRNPGQVIELFARGTLRVQGAFFIALVKIAVVGCGAVGSFYGGKLAHAGHELHFLLRSDYDAVRRQGVRVLSPQGDFQGRPRAARAPEEIGHSELGVVGLKTTANHEFGRLLGPLVGPDTAVLTLQNGLGNEERLAALFRPEQVLGGLCFVCLNRLQPGVIHHIDHGQVILGEFGRWPEPRTHDLASVFRNAGVPCKVTNNLARAHWEKLTWNIPFNGLGVAGTAGYEAVISGQVAPNQENHVKRKVDAELEPETPRPECLATDRLLGTPHWRMLASELMLEVIAAAKALGFDLADSLVEEQFERTRTMGAYKASTLIDFERGRALELEALFLEPLRRARAAGVAVPRLEAMCAVLQELEAARVVGAGT